MDIQRRAVNIPAIQSNFAIDSMGNLSGINHIQAVIIELAYAIKNSGNIVWFVWVKAHVMVLGGIKKAVQELTRRATDERELSMSRVLYRVSFSRLKKTILGDWYLLCNMSDKGFFFFRLVNHKALFFDKEGTTKLNKMPVAE